jgi:hypothetical protein
MAAVGNVANRLDKSTNASAGSVFRGITWFPSTLRVGLVYPRLPRNSAGKRTAYSWRYVTARRSAAP